MNKKLITVILFLAAITLSACNKERMPGILLRMKPYRLGRVRMSIISLLSRMLFIRTQIVRMSLNTIRFQGKKY